MSPDLPNDDLPVYPDELESLSIPTDDDAVFPTKSEIAHKAYVAMTGSEPSFDLDAYMEKKWGKKPNPTPTPAKEITYLNLDAEIKPVDWMVDGWVARKEVMLLAGRAGGGKSTTAVDLAVNVAMGNGDGWMGGKIANCPVLYLDEEAGPDEITRQFQRQGARNNPNLFVASSQHLRLDNPSHIDLLDREIQDKHIGFIVLDTATHFFMGADENSAVDIATRFLPIFHWRDDLNVTTLIIHHLRKAPSSGATDDLFDRIRGSSAYTTQPTTIWTQVRQQNSSYIELKVWKRRGGNSDRTCRIDYLETFDGHIKLSFAGESEQRESENTECEKFIAELLREDGEHRTRAQIGQACEAANYSERTINRSLKTLVDVGAIYKPKHGIYCTLSHQPDTLRFEGDDES